MTKAKFLVLFTVFIDVIGLGIIIPVMPTYVESFGASPSEITILFSVFAFFSFLSAPILGGLSDQWGRRPILLISILSSAIGWFVFASAHSLLLLFIGRIIDGLAAGNFPTAQSAIADMAKDDSERTANIGLTGMIFGIGFLVGPFLGGVLSTVSHAFPFWFVAFLSFANFISAYFFLPETHTHRISHGRIQWNPFVPLIQGLKDIKVRKLYITWFSFNAIAMASNTIFALYLSHVFGFGSYGSGLFFTGIGVIIAFNQGFALKKFWLKHFTEKKLIVGALAAFVVGFACMSYPVLLFFIGGITITAFAQSLLRVAITSEVYGETPRERRGQASGVLSSVASVATIVGPLIAGYVFEYGHALPYMIMAGMSLCTVIYIAKRIFPRIDPDEAVKADVYQ